MQHPKTSTTLVLNEDHTLGNLIAVALRAHAAVKFASYRKKNVEKTIELRIDVKSQLSTPTTPKVVLHETIDCLQTELSKLHFLFSDALKRHQQKMEQEDEDE
jgi:DNA-directed RNA polymerase subunit L